MDCQIVKQELVAFLDNEVSATTKAQIEAHLTGCPVCSQEMRALQASWQMLDRNLPPGPGSDFTASVMNRIRQTPQSGQELKPAWAEQFLPSLIVVAVILVAFLMGLLVWDHLRPITKVTAVQLPEPSVEPEVPVLPQEAEPVVPVITEAVVGSKEVIPAEIKPVIVPQVIPMVPVVAVPRIAKVDQDRDIIANLDMYENAEMLKKMDVIADMDAVASMKETAS